MDKIEQAAFVAQFWDGKFPVVIYDIAKAAHRAGWEQAKAEAKLLSFSCACNKAVAGMEYGG